MDSYRQRHISQSDCEISSNCGKNNINYYMAFSCSRYNGRSDRLIVGRFSHGPTTGL